MVGAIEQYAVSVYPTSINKVDIVIKNKYIRSVNQLKVADVRKNVRLHYSNGHAGLFCTRNNRRAMKSISS
jgi:hypothetical protein